MIEVEPGHIYDLQTHGGKLQRLTFVKTLPEGDPCHDGVLNQEVIRALICRLLELYRQKPHPLTHELIELERRALLLHEVRAFEETVKKSYVKTGLTIEQLPVMKNGHLYDPRQ